VWKTLWKNIKNVMKITLEWLEFIGYMVSHMAARLILYIYHGVVSWCKHTFQRRNDMTDTTNTTDDAIVINANAGSASTGTDAATEDATENGTDSDNANKTDNSKNQSSDGAGTDDKDGADAVAGDAALAEQLAALTAAKAADDAKIAELAHEKEVNDLAKSTGVSADLLSDTGLTGDKLAAYADKLKKASIGINPAAAAVRQQAIGAQLTSKKVDPWDQLAQQISQSLGH